MPPWDDSIRKALQALCARQSEDGSWDFPCEFDPSGTALFLLLRHYLGRHDEVIEAGMVRYLRHEQLADGGWGGSPDSDADLDISLLCYAALRAAGVPSADGAMVRGRERIGMLGGIGAAGFVHRLVLRMLGQIPSEALPHVSPRGMQAMRFIPFLAGEMNFLALGLEPLGLLHEEQVRPLAPDRGVAELATLGARWRMRPDRKAGVAPPPALSALVDFLAWSGGRAISRAFRWIDAVLPPRRARQQSVRRILDHRGPDGTFGEMVLPTALNLMALDNAGLPEASEAVGRALAVMESWIVREARGAWIPWTPATTHYTARFVEGLERFPQTDPAALAAAGWLFRHQAVVAGSWEKSLPLGIRPGGWCFGRDNPWLVDTDDTALVLKALRRFRHLDPEGYRRGIEWLLAMEDQDGGWASFTVNARLLARIPPGLVDPAIASSVWPDEDITARALIALAPHATPEDDPAGTIRAAVRRSLDFLWRRRRPDGTWFGRWAVNYAYGTAQVIEALVACGQGRDPRAQASLRWIESVQNPDGGWGESKRSYHTGHFEPGPSNPMVTAFALRALVAGGTAAEGSVDRALWYIIATQDEDGLWSDPGWNGVCIPGLSYIRYNPTAFVLDALARARDHLDARPPLRDSTS